MCPALLVGLFFQQLRADSPLSHQEMLPVLCRGCLLPLEEAPAFGAGFCCPPAPLQCITATTNLVTAGTIA